MLLAAAGLGAGYQLGGERLSSETLQTHAEMQQQLAVVEAERNDLRRQLTMAEQAAQVDKKALASVKAEIEALQDERLKMEEELVFTAWHRLHQQEKRGAQGARALSLSRGWRLGNLITSLRLARC